jgi:LysM repeat protein
VSTAILAVMSLACLSGCVDAPEPSVTATLIPFKASTATAARPLVTPTIEPLPTAGPSPTPFSHAVQEKDTLLSIAARYGITLEALEAANPGINPRLLSIGQTLVIPSPEGTPDPLTASVATPVPLELTPVRCFRLVTGDATCLLAAHNPATNPPVEGVVALVTLLDAAGRPIDTRPAYPALNRAEPGEWAMLTASFGRNDSDWAQAVATLESAFENPLDDGRYIDVVVTRAVQHPAEDRQSWRIEGEARLGGEPTEGEVRTSVVLVALDEQDGVVGYTHWEPTAPFSSSQAMAFDLTVYSLGPTIDRVIILTEAQAPAGPTAVAP